MCWLCHGEGPDESGKPLRRDCSCRGGSGFAHLPCIVEYAKQKTEHRLWKICPNCKQRYQNELAVDLAHEFVSFVEEKSPGDQRMYIRALSRKLHALMNDEDILNGEIPADGQLPKKAEEAKEVANKILSLIGQLRAEDPSLPQAIQINEARAHNSLGIIVSMIQAEEDTKAAMRHYEKSRDVFDEMGDAKGVSVVECNIAMLTTTSERGNKLNLEERLEKSRAMYEHYVKNRGQDDSYTIRNGVYLAKALIHTNRIIEADRLLTKLTAASKRVHGPDHDLTKRADLSLQGCKERWVKIKYQSELEYLALRYEEDGKKYVLQGPVSEPRNIDAEETFIVPTKNITYYNGTPVVCQGMDDHLSHLNGKIGDVRGWKKHTGRYKIHFEDGDLQPCYVEPNKIRILFELPDE